MDFSEMFKDERENGATRLQQCHQVLRRMFKIVDHLCTKHDIQYFLSSGTLLGAIRNADILPWDDDFDIAMTRENYEKFVQLAVPDLPQDIFFQTPETDPNYPVCHVVEVKLRDRYSSYTFRSGKGDGRHNGLMIDLLVLDRAYLPHNFFIYIINKTLRTLYKHKDNSRRANVLKWIERNFPFKLVYSYGLVCQWKQINEGQNFFKEEEIANVIRIPFADTQAWIPEGWDAYLKRKFGPKYLQGPPIEQQVAHHSDEVPDPFTPCDHKQALVWRKGIGS